MYSDLRHNLCLKNCYEIETRETLKVQTLQPNSNLNDTEKLNIKIFINNEWVST